MSVYADDVVSFTSVLKIAYNFLTGRDYLLKKKTKEKKKLISVALGFPDLVYAADSIPVFPIRMEKFKINLYLLALNTAKSLFGWNITTNLLGIARQLDFLKIVDSVINVRKIPKTKIQYPPHYTAKVDMDFINGMYQLDDQIIIFLEIKKILSPEEHNYIKNQDFYKDINQTD